VSADLDRLYRELRGYAFAIAYRMLGSVSDAEDVVQEAFVRLARGVEEPRSDRAYLAMVTTRLALDQLRSSRARRETYPGPWLPEPLVGELPEPAELADSLSMAFLVLLEALNPVERAVFLLHDVFGYDYPEIAGMVDKTEANCRQLAARARKRVRDRPRFEATRAEQDRLACSFLAACRGQDVDGLVTMLARDAAFYGDGGAKGTGVPQPVFGRERVAALVAAIVGAGVRLGVSFEFTHVNGQPGARCLDPQGRLINVLCLDVADGVVRTVRSVVNPDKLGHLGTLSPIGRRGPERE
jgi:RNA polymerase sigma-70 factor (ECF subfamily)